MSSRYADETNVLARKVRGPKMRLAGFPAMEPLCHAFASLAATRSRVELRPGIEVSVYGYEAVRHGDYLRGLFAPSAIYLLSFREGMGSGLMKAHPRLLGKVLDIYLGGDGSFEESNFERSLTAIDLSIYGRFVDLISRCFDEAILEICGRSEIGVARRSRFEQLPGMVRIAPDKAEVFVMKLNFHVADDKRGAGLDFVVPVSTLEMIKRDLVAAQRTADSTVGIWKRHMLNQVHDMPLPLGCVVPLGGFTVNELSKLERGALFPLPDDVLARIELRAKTRDGPVKVAEGKLGVVDRTKAVKLSCDPSPEFLAPLRGLDSLANRS